MRRAVNSELLLEVLTIGISLGTTRERAFVSANARDGDWKDLTCRELFRAMNGDREAMARALEYLGIELLPGEKAKEAIIRVCLDGKQHRRRVQAANKLADATRLGAPVETLQAIMEELAADIEPSRLAGKLAAGG